MEHRASHARRPADLSESEVTEPERAANCVEIALAIEVEYQGPLRRAAAYERERHAIDRAGGRRADDARGIAADRGDRPPRSRSTRGGQARLPRGHGGGSAGGVARRTPRRRAARLRHARSGRRERTAARRSACRRRWARCSGSSAVRADQQARAHSLHLATSRTPVEARRLPGIVLRAPGGMLGPMPKYPPRAPRRPSREEGRRGDPPARRGGAKARGRGADFACGRGPARSSGAGRLGGSQGRAPRPARGDCGRRTLPGPMPGPSGSRPTSVARRRGRFERRTSRRRRATTSGRRKGPWRPGAPRRAWSPRTAAAGTTHGAAGSKQGKRRRRPRRGARSVDGLEAESDRVGARGLPRVDVRERVSRRQRAGSAPRRRAVPADCEAFR